MMSWGFLTAEQFVREVTDFLASNPFEEDGAGGPFVYQQV